jgi:hypothetical protein
MKSTLLMMACALILTLSFTACGKSHNTAMPDILGQIPFFETPEPSVPMPVVYDSDEPEPEPDHSNYFVDGRGFEFTFQTVGEYVFIRVNDYHYAHGESAGLGLPVFLIGNEKYFILCPIQTPITTLLTDEGDEPSEIDRWTISLDGVVQTLPISAVFRNGRMSMDAAFFTLALGLNKAEHEERHLFELTEEYGLFAYFNRRRGTLELFSGYERPEQLPAVDGNRSAFLRFEDVIAQGKTYHNRDMLNRRVMADLLYSHNAAFSIAWVPVNVRPSEDFRNDPRDYSRYNLEFIFTMDYKLSRGGQLGLHGYTHQRGNQNSVAGYDFGPGVSEAEARENFENQLAAASYFGWTPYSFTFPKYIGTDAQYQIAGEYFDFIMPNFNTRGSNNPRRVQIGDKQILYMNTVEDHLIDETERQLAALLNRLSRAGNTASFFFHTWLDYRYITVSRDEDNLLVIEYDTDSPLHRILDNLRENGRTLRPTTYFFD